MLRNTEPRISAATRLNVNHKRLCHGFFSVAVLSQMIAGSPYCAAAACLWDVRTSKMLTSVSPQRRRTALKRQERGLQTPVDGPNGVTPFHSSLFRDLGDCRVYDLRSTFATRANAARATGLTLAHLLGHSSTAILPTYAKALDENTRAVISQLDCMRRARSATSVQ